MIEETFALENNKNINQNNKKNVEENKEKTIDIEPNLNYYNLDNYEDESSRRLISTAIDYEIKKQRVYWVDWLRVFASILVVYIHVSYVNLDRGELFSHKWNGLFLHNSIPRPCVPLFIMISGIFFLDPNKKVPIKKIFKKYIYHIVKCLYFWSVYYSIVDKCFVNFGRVNYIISKEFVISTIKEIILQGGHFWYLYFVIGLYLFTPQYRCFTKNRSSAWYVFALSSFFGQFFPTLTRFCNVFLKNDINIITSFASKLMLEMQGSSSAYYILGYLLSTQDFTKTQIIIIYLVGLASLILTVILRFLECHIKNGEGNDFGSYESFNVMLSTVGIFVFFKYTVNKWIEPLMKFKYIKKFIMKLSECSFGIYLVHMTIFNLFHRYNFLPFTFDPYYFVPVYTIIVFTCSFIVIFLLRLIPFFKQVT